jgi:glycerol-3-phosphate dehydrogenase (NAD(P)+)
MPRIAIVGATTWGATLGVVLARKGHYVRLLARTDEEAAGMQANTLRNLPLPGGKFPSRMTFTASPQKAIGGVRLVIVAVTSQTMRQNMQQIARYVTKDMLVVSAVKGLEIETGKRMTEVMADELPAVFRPNIGVVSGPNLAREILGERPAATVAAFENLETARALQRMLNAPQFCVYTNTDVVGVELGGALKNIIALAAGIADGLGFGDNAKAALMTRGWAEITALGEALGANPLTFSGLAGLGDMIATCASPLSRNHTVGVEITRGRKLEEITDSLDNVAEGVGTTVAAYRLSRKLGIGMPITEKIYQVLYEGLEPRQAALDLQSAETHHELEGRKWRLLTAMRKRNGISGKKS